MRIYVHTCVYTYIYIYICLFLHRKRVTSELAKVYSVERWGKMSETCEVRSKWKDLETEYILLYFWEEREREKGSLCKINSGQAVNFMFSCSSAGTGRCLHTTGKETIHLERLKQ